MTFRGYGTRIEFPIPVFPGTGSVLSVIFPITLLGLDVMEEFTGLSTDSS